METPGAGPSRDVRGRRQPAGGGIAQDLDCAIHRVWVARIAEFGDLASGNDQTTVPSGIGNDPRVLDDVDCGRRVVPESREVARPASALEFSDPI